MFGTAWKGLHAREVAGPEAVTDISSKIFKTAPKHVTPGNSTKGDGGNSERKSHKSYRASHHMLLELLSHSDLYRAREKTERLLYSFVLLRLSPHVENRSNSHHRLQNAELRERSKTRKRSSVLQKRVRRPRAFQAQIPPLPTRRYEKACFGEAPAPLLASDMPTTAT